MKCNAYFEDGKSIKGDSFIYLQELDGKFELNKIILLKNSLKDLGKDDFVNIITLNGEIELFGDDPNIERYLDFSIIYLGKPKYFQCSTVKNQNGIILTISSRKSYYSSKNILIKSQNSINIPDSSIFVSNKKYKWSHIVFETFKTKMIINLIY